MSFNFSASGNRRQVVGQLQAALRSSPDSSSAEAEALRKSVAKLLIDTVTGDQEAPTAADYQYHYYVSASGHAGPGYGTSLNVQITPHYVPKVTETEKET